MNRDIDKLTQEARKRIKKHPRRDFTLKELRELQKGDDLIEIIIRAVRFGYALGYRHALDDVKKKQ